MRSRGVVAAVLAGFLLAGCAQSVDPIERLGMKAAQRVGSYGPAGRAATLPVVRRVATTDKVVFLTYDDGAERDPRFVDLVRERRLPVSMFLTDSVVGPGYGHFARLLSVGASIQNHTLDHPALRGLPYAGQRAEICGQQEKVRSRFGVRPTLFRPPYGTYDRTTLRAAADCGLTAVVLWNVSMAGAEPSAGLRAGDIVSLPSGETSGESPGPTLTERTTRLLEEIRKRGLRVGRLEEYLGKTGRRAALD
ncbi:polysaccharide deacetylase family protein [Streptomyces sp. NPDC047072]|uniref:polysaccharide deacetylase family protein n=1 Tax=Streptomyces sp. NPDC047072 TaxID=3154809 RepID=UPI0033FC6993